MGVAAAGGEEEEEVGSPPPCAGGKRAWPRRRVLRQPPIGCRRPETGPLLACPRRAPRTGAAAWPVGSLRGLAPVGMGWPRALRSGTRLSTRKRGPGRSCRDGLARGFASPPRLPTLHGHLFSIAYEEGVSGCMRMAGSKQPKETPYDVLLSGAASQTCQAAREGEPSSETF